VGTTENAARTRAAVRVEPDWEVTEGDLASIALGAAILGTGGGGNPYLGTLRARQALRAGMRFLIVDPDSLPDDVVLAAAGGIGAPVASYEKIERGDEEILAVKALEAHLGTRVDAVAPLEVGGGNSMRALVTGGLLGLPILDGDGMGRAFPELSMITYLIYGGPVSPAALVDEHGRCAVLTGIDDPRSLESLARTITVEMGAHAGLAMCVMDGAHARTSCVPRTLSLAVRLGRAVTAARDEGSDAVAAAFGAVGGRRLFQGKIVDVRRQIVGGFSRGSVAIEGLDGDIGRRVTVDFQNENLIARDKAGVLAMVPDLISLVDRDTAEPVTTEALRYGFRVDLLVIPASPQLTTQRALEFVGPRAFGYDFDWVPAFNALSPE
jgi:DUF917 family protein